MSNGAHTMRGGGLHRRLVRDLALEAGHRGWWTRVEAYVGGGYIDLVIGKGDRLIAVEVELTPDRVPRDIEKAERIHATELWIVIPDSTKRAAFERRVLSANTRSGTRILVFTYPQAIKALTPQGAQSCSL